MSKNIFGKFNKKDKKKKKKTEIKIETKTKPGKKAGEKPRVEGILSINRKGFGFVTPLEGEGKDIFIGKRDLNGAMQGDRVEVQILPSRVFSPLMGEEAPGVITTIKERAIKELVGIFRLEKNYAMVFPEGRKSRDPLFIHKNEFNGAHDGDIVVAEIVEYPGKNRSARGRVTEIVSKDSEAGGDIKALIRAAGLSKSFPSKAEEEAYKVSEPMKTPDGAYGLIPKADLAGRKDLRGKKIVTIDGADSKDFDDAISLELTPTGNYLLGVHIADVSHYVKDGGPLDEEAMGRGNSVYLIDQVVPMLPEVLSNKVCSLNPGVDRLTLSIDIEISPSGKVINHEIYESVIRSSCRMVYTEVSDLLEKKAVDILSKYVGFHQELERMEELASILRRRRKARGSLDFEFDEAYIVLDEEGIPLRIDVAERRVANEMIEEFMLLANEVVAEHFNKMELPFVYRVHQKPSLEKLEEFRVFLQGFGLQLKGEGASIHPGALNDILERVKDEPYKHVINTVMLRSMSKAFYSTDCEGHFGLGLTYYCHFTSPIRRYPDLMIHRIIKSSMRVEGKGGPGGLTEKEKKRYLVRTKSAADRASVTERQAQELERDVEKLKKAQYMEGHIGKIFDGIISGVNTYGLYVELPNTVEGMIRLDSIPGDYYEYERSKYRVVGKRTNTIYTLGDKVKIQVSSVSISEREVNFELLLPVGVPELGGKEHHNGKKLKPSRKHQK